MRIVKMGLADAESTSKVWSSVGFLSQGVHSVGLSLLNWLPLPEDSERRFKVLCLFAAAGAMMFMGNQAERRSLKSKVHLPFSPRRIAMNYAIFNIEKLIPLWKKIYYYVTQGYDYHSTVTAEEIRRLKKTNREQYEELMGGKRTLPYAECQRRDTSTMWRIKKDYPNEEITNEQEEAESPDDDEMLMLSLDNMLRSLGHFTRKVKMEILDRADRKSYPKRHQLFKIGDMDDSMYFIVSGSVEIIFHSEKEVDNAELKIAKKGDHINSFFSFIDAVTGYMKPYRSVEAICREDSIIIRIPFTIFKDCWLTDSQKIVAGIRSVIMRIFQVNYLVFDQLLGLRSEFCHFNTEPTPADLVVDWDDGFDDTDEDVGSVRHVSKSLQKEAIDGLIAFFRIPKESREILKEAEVSSLDVCHGTAPITIDYFYYIHKGVVETFKMNRSAGDEIGEVNVDFSDCNKGDEDALKHEQHVLWLYAGESFGGQQILSGDSGYMWRRLLCKSVLVRLSLETFMRLLNKYPEALYSVTQSFIKRVSKFARQMDFCLEWRRLDSGDTLFVPNAESDDTFVVLNGLLKSERKEASGKVNEIGVYKRRDWVGLVESLTGVLRSKYVVAHRETEVAKLPSSFINSIKKKFPIVAPVLMNYLAKRVLQKYGTSEMPRTLRKRCSTMTLVPVSAFAPTYVFALDLMKSYCCETGGSAVIVTQQDVCAKLNLPSFMDINDVFVNEWLATLEDRHDLIIYLIDNCICPWSYKCCSASDIIMGVVTSKDLRKELREIEVFYDIWSENSKKELVICHEIIKHPGGTTPFGTKGWLEPRPWLSRHHHIRYPPSAFKFATAKDIAFVNKFYRPLREVHDKHSDIARISRWLSGQSTGIVFGSSTLEGSLWRLARAAATRIKSHPPMCDPVDGGYLVDGSYCHPVPTNLMRKFGAAFVITVEIASPGNYNIMESPYEADQTTPVTYTEIPSLFDIREVLSNTQATFYQKKQAVKDKFNMTVSVDISTDEDAIDIDHELYSILLHRGYGHMFYRLKIIFADRIENKKEFWSKMHAPQSPPPERLDDDSAECHRLLYEEKLRYQRNNVQEIIENFESSNLQFLRAGQLL